MRGALRGIRLEYEIAARELIAHLVEVLPVEFEARTEGMFAAAPGEIVDELQRIVLNYVRPVRAIADAAEAVAIERDRGDAPGSRVARIKPRNPERPHYVVRAGGKRPDGVVDP